MKKLISILIIFGLILPGFTFAQSVNQPQDLKEVQKTGEKVLKETKELLPGILERIWKEEVLPIWKRMLDWFLVNIWSKFKPIIKKEFQKEKKEMEESAKKEVQKAKTSLWEKFKELIK